MRAQLFQRAGCRGGPGFHGRAWLGRDQGEDIAIHLRDLIGGTRRKGKKRAKNRAMSESPISELGAPVIVIAGPTASGKSALALAVAREFGGTIINADSMQVYRDLRVLTARPGEAELARAPHRLYGVIDAGESCSAGRWRSLALAEIARAREAGRLPMLVGGTGLYLSALLDGLAAVPPVPAAVVAEARALHARLGGEHSAPRWPSSIPRAPRVSTPAIRSA